MKCTVKVPAKINLSLDVVGKRADGYHLLETVMQSIDLYDTITVTLTDSPEPGAGGIRIIADRPTFPCDSRNTCYKAAEQFLYAMKSPTNILIHIDKKIPQAAGLAGGSADAAAVLTALNHLSGFPFTMEALIKIGAKVGADVPFCLVGGTVLCTGIGEILEPLPPLNGHPVVLVKPDFGVSTSWVFGKLDMTCSMERPDTDGVVQAIVCQDFHALFAGTANVLESVTLPAYPVLVRIKKALLDAGATGSMMSGSGPTIFGVFQTEDAADAACADIRSNPAFASYTVIRTRTIRSGPQFAM